MGKTIAVWKIECWTLPEGSTILFDIPENNESGSNLSVIGNKWNKIVTVNKEMDI